MTPPESSLPSKPGRPSAAAIPPEEARQALRLSGVATLALLALIVYVRTSWGWDYGWPEPAAYLPGLGDLWVLEAMIGGLLVPLVLAYPLSRHPSLARLIEGRARPSDRTRALITLGLVQLVAVPWAIGSGANFLGYFVVMIAGLICGWRGGLALGTWTYVLLALTLGLQEMFEAWSFRELVGIEWRSVPARAGELLAYLGRFDLAPSVWIGFAAAALGARLGADRFRPALGFALGAGLVVCGGYFTALFETDPEWITQEYLLPSALATGLALAGFNLIVSDLRASLERRNAEQAELARTRAELKALRAQINPHFLFNSLNTIRYFARTDPEEARRLLLSLSEVFQQALRAGERVPLEDELRHVEGYLALETARLGDRLRVVWDVGQEVPREALLPTLILQPIVENAVVHGIAPDTEGGALRISIQREGDRLLLEVADEGVGMPAERLRRLLEPADSRTDRTDRAPGEAGEDDTHAAPAARSSPPSALGSGESIGLRNVHQRLRALFGEDHGLTIESRPGEGTRVRFEIPIDDSRHASDPDPNPNPQEG